MKRLLKILSIVVLALGLFACSGKRYEGKIIAVEVDIGAETLEGASLVLLDPGKPEKGPEKLFENFHSTASPALSHDASYLVFSAKENQEDPWQIWVVDLKKMQVNQVTDLPENCSFPTILPDMKVVFTRDSEYMGKSASDLWKCGMDGCCLTQLTHNPSHNQHSSMLWEGRILYLDSRQWLETGSPRFMLMKPDGAKAELYSPGKGELTPVSKAVEGPDGFVYFISTGGKLCRVLHRRPLHTFALLAENIKGSFAGVHPCPDSSLLVSHKAAGESTYSICRFDPNGDKRIKILFSGEKNLLDPLPIRLMDPRPKILPSAIDPTQATGQLLVQDINHSMLPVHEGITAESYASSIRFSNMEGELATVEAKEDGSVYVKLDADMPFRMETLNSQGEVLRGPSDWIYLRPKERSACTGCHANPELAPRNFQPHAVKLDPVVLVQSKEEEEER